MSSRKKRAVVENNETVDDSQISIQNEIQADFEGRNAEAEDFHGIKQLLKQLFLKAHVDTSQLSDLIIAQTGLGSVLKQSYDDEGDDDDDDMEDSGMLDVFGITTVLNLSCEKANAVKQLLSLLTSFSDEHADKTTQARVNFILSNSNKLGLIINERFLNIPAKVADPLFTSLESDINRITKKEPSYNFQYYIMICKMCKPKDGGDTIFLNAEEEVFDKEADFSFEFNVSSESDTAISGSWSEDDSEMIPYRRVLFFNANKFPVIIQKVREFVM